MRSQRGIAAPRSYNRYTTAPGADGRGASTVFRRKPHGKDPYAVGEGRNDTAAQLEYLASKRRS